jgi:hypothetical protein
MLTLSHQDYHRQSVYWPRSSSTLLVRINLINILNQYTLSRTTAQTRLSSVQKCSATGLLHHHHRVATSRHTAWLSQHYHPLQIVELLFGTVTNVHDCCHLGYRPYRL